MLPPVGGQHSKNTHALIPKANDSPAVIAGRGLSLSQNVGEEVQSEAVDFPQTAYIRKDSQSGSGFGSEAQETGCAGGSAIVPDNYVIPPKTSYPAKTHIVWPVGLAPLGYIAFPQGLGETLRAFDRG
jgi:hypothetical protein